MKMKLVLLQESFWFRESALIYRPLALTMISAFKLFSLLFELGSLVLTENPPAFVCAFGRFCHSEKTAALFSDLVL